MSDGTFPGLENYAKRCRIERAKQKAAEEAEKEDT